MTICLYVALTGPPGKSFNDLQNQLFIGADSHLSGQFDLATQLQKWPNAASYIVAYSGSTLIHVNECLFVESVNMDLQGVFFVMVRKKARVQ